VMVTVVAFASGLLFALGLGVSGMTRPEKVLAFLDVAGRWDPSLAFVMLGAIGVHAVLLRVILRRRAPLLAPAFALPVRSEVDARLLVGAAIFGVGWGLAGLCPGPAVTVLASGRMLGVAFVLAMLVGMLAVDVSERTLTAGGAPRRMRAAVITRPRRR